VLKWLVFFIYSIDKIAYIKSKGDSFQISLIFQEKCHLDTHTLTIYIERERNEEIKMINIIYFDNVIKREIKGT